MDKLQQEMNINKNITIVGFKFPKITISKEVKELIKEWGIRIAVLVCLVVTMWCIENYAFVSTGCAC